MTKLEALKALEQKVAAGDRVDLDNAAASAFPPESGGGPCTFHLVFRAFEGSLDAALSLHQAVLPGWHGHVETDGEVTVLEHVGADRAWFGSCDDNMARAWLLAIIRALITMEEQG